MSFSLPFHRCSGYFPLEKNPLGGSAIPPRLTIGIKRLQVTIRDRRTHWSATNPPNHPAGSGRQLSANATGPTATGNAAVFAH